MRQVTLLLATVFLFGINCFGQNENKVKGLKDNIAKSDEATQDPKKSINPKTWMDRGKLFQDVYGLNVSYLRPGMPTNEAKLYFKEPKNIETSEEGGAVKETYVYGQIRLNFENGGLRTWEETQTIIDNPLMKAVAAYQKASSLDEKGKNAKKINEAYKLINTDLESKAFNEYYGKRYKEAYNTALDKIEVGKLLGISDTMFYYYAGFFAYDQSMTDNSMWQETIDNFGKALSFSGFKDPEKGGVYPRIYQAYTHKGDTLGGFKYLKEGFEKYSDNLEVIYALINHYLVRGESREALEYVGQAKAKDPNNPNLLFAEGALYDKLGDKDKSIEAYDAAIAADPKKFDPYYNKAVVYYNSAIKLMEEANNEKTNEGFEAKRDIAEAEFMKAIPPLEKAHELNPADRDIMETLKTLYYRLKTKHPELDAKYNDIVKKLESGI